MCTGRRSAQGCHDGAGKRTTFPGGHRCLSAKVEKVFWVDDEGPVGGQRNGAGIGERLQQCSLYDPSLDLAVEIAEGQVKVSYETPGAAALYQGLGFRPQSSTTWCRAPSRGQLVGS